MHKSYTFYMQRQFSAALLFSFFLASFILTPYWRVFDNTLLNTLMLITLIAVGTIWTLFSAGSFTVNIKWLNVVLLVLLGTAITLLNLKPMTSVIPWMGDEDFHIKTVQILLHHAKRIYPAFISILVFIIFCHQKKRGSIALAVVTVVICIGCGFLIRHNTLFTLRYPFATRYLQLLPFAITGFNVDTYSEALFRVVPLISSIFLAHIIAGSYRPDGMSGKLLVGISAASMPLIHYYSSILYLEMPAVVLMTIACMDMERLVTGDLSTLKTRPSWYALILIGFVKETTFPFIASFALCRTVYHFGWNFKSLTLSSFRKIIVQEVKINFCLFSAIFLYLACRKAGGIERSYSADFTNFINIQAYTAYSLSFFQQFGFFCILMVTGMGADLIKRKYIFFFFTILAMICTVSFHMADNSRYAGYSRFNLFLVPLLLTWSIKTLNLVPRKRFFYPVIVVILLTNFHLSPINSDGSKKKEWGNYLISTSEHYYPYKSAIKWLSDNRSSSRVLYGHRSYPYYFSFYFNKYKWDGMHQLINKKLTDRNDSMALDKALTAAMENQCDLVVFQPLDEEPLAFKGKHQYKQIRIFENAEYSLLIFEKQDKTTAGYQHSN